MDYNGKPWLRFYDPWVAGEIEDSGTDLQRMRRRDIEAFSGQGGLSIFRSGVVVPGAYG